MTVAACWLMAGWVTWTVRRTCEPRSHIAITARRPRIFDWATDPEMRTDTADARHAPDFSDLIRTRTRTHIG